MFQNTLLIIKFDCLPKRKALLIFLLQQGFQIQGQRKLLFTPELAAEFYQDITDDPCFMFHVILLSKGNSEAFILAKECAVEDLINAMVCYFGTSIEMERNVHITKCHTKLRQEINFIFPNYIHEPIMKDPEQITLYANNSMVSSMISELYDILTKSDKNPDECWKEKLAEWLVLSNKALPQVSNQCCHNPKMHLQEKSQQTNFTGFKHDKFRACSLSSSDMVLDTDGSSFNVSSSSCMTCSCFGSVEECMPQMYIQPMEDIIKTKTAPFVVKEFSSCSEENTSHEDTAGEWLAEEIIEDENIVKDVLRVRNTGKEYDTEQDDVISAVGDLEKVALVDILEEIYNLAIDTAVPVSNSETYDAFKASLITEEPHTQTEKESPKTIDEASSSPTEETSQLPIQKASQPTEMLPVAEEALPMANDSTPSYTE